MNVYSIDVKLYATAYIKADTEEEALQIAEGLKLTPIEVPTNEDGEVEISGREFHDPDLPDVSLSPAMTIHGPEDGETPELVFP